VSRSATGWLQRDARRERSGLIAHLLRAVRPALPLLAACVMGATVGHAWGNDRPYQATWLAVADEDDEGVWSVESWVTRLGSVRTFNVAPEYAFQPTTMLQLEMARADDRAGGGWSTLAELEFKQLFNHIARDGYGWGVVLTYTGAKGADSRWKRDEWSVKLPLSVSLWEGDGFVHLNASRGQQGEERARWGVALALEREVLKRTRLFGEVAREGNTTFVHGGVRYWVKRERLAIDFSLQRERADGATRNGAIIGIGWYDL
jgi:hypothetical protein